MNHDARKIAANDPASKPAGCMMEVQMAINGVSGTGQPTLPVQQQAPAAQSGQTAGSGQGVHRGGHHHRHGAGQAGAPTGTSAAPATGTTATATTDTTAGGATQLPITV